MKAIMTIQQIELHYRTKNGAHHCAYLRRGEDVYGRLTLLRKRGVTFARALVRDEYDCIEDVGGIEEAEGCDDRRLKWNVWAWRDPWN